MYPTLEGTQSQVASANAIRTKMLNGAEALKVAIAKNAPNEDQKRWGLEYIAEMETATTAEYWLAFKEQEKTLQQLVVAHIKHQWAKQPQG